MHFSFFTFFSVSCHIPDKVYVSHLSCFSVILAMLQVLKFALLIFHVFWCFSQYSRSNSVCVSFSTFLNFLAIFQVLVCIFLILHVFQCFLPYPRSYSVHFSFFTFYSVSCHIPGHSVFVSHFPDFSFFFFATI